MLIGCYSIQSNLIYLQKWIKIMHKITDEQILVFTDLHAGIKSNSFLRLDIAEELVDEIVKTIIDKKIKTVIFCGDWHHERPSISVETMCRSIRMIKKITKHAKLIFILGNHDIRDNVSTDVTSVKFLEDIDNVELIDKPKEIIMGENKVLLCPWLSDLSKYKAETYDGMFGHFDISHKYLIESYMEDHLSEDVSPAEVSNLMLKSGYEFQPIETTPDMPTVKRVNSKKHIGKFIDLCKKGGYIYSGHIHNRRSFTIKGRKFTFMGSPLQLTWGDYNKESNSSNRGYYIINTSNLRAKFIENNSSPVHKKYFISELPVETEQLEDIFLEDDIKGNFIRVILNKQFDFQKLNKILALINGYSPKEPCVVDYDFSIDFETNMGEAPDSSSLKTSKLKYIHDYVEGLEEQVFKDFSVDKETVLKYVTKYFEITEEQLT